MDSILNENLERGYRGTEKTVQRMHKLVAKGKLDPTMHKIASWIRLSVPHDLRGDGKATADAIFNFVRRHGLFQRDPFQIERIEHPFSSMRAIAEAREKGIYDGEKFFAGDCDLFSIWVATLGGLLGFHYAFETAKVDPARPDEFSHIWTSLLLGNEWYPLDASTRIAYPGWRPPVPPDRLKRWEERPIEKTMSGLGMNVPQNGSARQNGRKVPYYDPDPGEWVGLAPDQPYNDPQRTFDSSTTIPEGIWPSRVRPDLAGGPVYLPDSSAYYHVSKGRAPADRWSRPQKLELRDRRRPYYSVDYPDVPVYQARLADEKEPRRNGKMRHSFMTVRRRPTADGGMGISVSLPSGTVQEIAEKEVEQTSDNIMGTIEGVLKDVVKMVPSATEVLIERERNKYRTAVQGATATVTGQDPSKLKRPEAPKPWYTNPLVWIGGLIVGGGAVYAATR